MSECGVVFLVTALTALVVGFGLWFVLAGDREQDFTDEEDEF